MGDLHMHVHPGGLRVWVWTNKPKGKARWDVVVDGRYSHPTRDNYVLGYCDEFLATWVTKQTRRSYDSEQKRKSKSPTAKEEDEREWEALLGPGRMIAGPSRWGQ